MIKHKRYKVNYFVMTMSFTDYQNIVFDNIFYGILNYNV